MRKKNELRGYQQRVVKHLYEHDEAMAVLKMGAGKTISTLTAIDELIADGEIRHALIIAPKRVALSVWPAEIEAWEHTKWLKHAVLDGSPAERMAKLKDASKRRLTIIGIDNVQWLLDIIAGWDEDHPIFDLLVIDETSKLKNPKSKRGKALAKIAGRFRNRWGLTGTPNPNSLLDLFTPLKVITDGKLWGKSFYTWQKQHFYPIDRNGYQWRVLPGHAPIIQADAATVSIALGENEMPELPEISVLLDEVRLPYVARNAYDRMERKLFADLVEGDRIIAVSKAVATGKLAQAANGFMYDDDGASGAHTLHDEKASWISELVDDLDGEPLIIVYEFQEDLAMLRRLFGDLPYLGSGVSDAQANKHIEAWNKGQLPIFALHPASGGHGLNLQHGGSRMAWIAPTWSAELWDQTVARIHRPGQSNHVMIHVCIAHDTVDDLKRLRVISKLSQQQAFEQYLAQSSAGRVLPPQRAA
jgi:SNF2 family DNA or RNA helicase